LDSIKQDQYRAFPGISAWIEYAAWLGKNASIIQQEVKEDVWLLKEVPPAGHV